MRNLGISVVSDRESAGWTDVRFERPRLSISQRLPRMAWRHGKGLYGDVQSGNSQADAGPRVDGRHSGTLAEVDQLSGRLIGWSCCRSREMAALNRAAAVAGMAVASSE